LLSAGALLVGAGGTDPANFFLPAVLAAFAAAALGVVLFSAFPPVGKKAALLLFFMAFLLAAAVFVLRTSLSSRQFFGLPPERAAEITGTVLDDRAAVSGGRAMTTLRLAGVADEFGNRAEARGRIAVFCHRTFSPDKGSLVRFEVELFEPEGQGIRNEYLASAQSSAEVLKVPGGIQKRRAALVDYLLGRIHSTGRNSSGLWEALLIGYSGGRSRGLYDLFRRSGNAHLLALSGMHLGILSLGVMVLLVPLLGRKKAVSASLFVAVFYLFLAGPKPSLVRAVLMYALGSGAFLIYGRKTDIFHLLVMSFVIQVYLDPASAGTLGFQLSYLALGGILLWSGLVERSLPFWIPGGIRQVLAAGVSAQLSTAFLLVKSFGILYPFGIFTVLFLSPLIVIWMWAGILYVLWSLWAVFITGPWVVKLDLLLRGGIESAARATVALVELSAGLPSIRVEEELWGAAALAGVLLLTLLSVSRYAGRHAADRKLQLSRGNKPFSGCQWSGTKPPVWTKFSHIPGGAGADSEPARAA
jgi:ComEC/Rec2-related protein